MSNKCSTKFSGDEETMGDRDSEIQLEEDIEEFNPFSNSAFFVAKDKTEWGRTTSIQRQASVRNIVRQRCGPHRSTETLSISATFKFIFINEMINMIVTQIKKQLLNMKNTIKKNLAKNSSYGRM